MDRQRLHSALCRFGLGDWANVSRHMLPCHVHRSAAECEARWASVKDRVVKGPWLPEEDQVTTLEYLIPPRRSLSRLRCFFQMLRELVANIGPRKWSVIAASIPGRAGKQCRERWLNHLDAAVKKSDWAPEVSRASNQRAHSGFALAQ